MDETQQKQERDVRPYEQGDFDEIAQSLPVYKYYLEHRRWKKLPRFMNKTYYKGFIEESFVHDLCASNDSICICMDGYGGIFRSLKPDQKEPEWKGLA